MYIGSIREMNQEYLPETRCETIHKNSNPASMRDVVFGENTQGMPLDIYLWGSSEKKINIIK